MDIGHVVTVVLVTLAAHLLATPGARRHVPEFSVPIGRIALDLNLAKLHSRARCMYARTSRGREPGLLVTRTCRIRLGCPRQFGLLTAGRSHPRSRRSRSRLGQ